MLLTPLNWNHHDAFTCSRRLWARTGLDRTEANFGLIRTGSDCNMFENWRIRTGSDWENLLFWCDYSNHIKHVSCNLILQLVKWFIFCHQIAKALLGRFCCASNFVRTPHRGGAKGVPGGPLPPKILPGLPQWPPKIFQVSF